MVRKKQEKQITPDTFKESNDASNATMTLGSGVRVTTRKGKAGSKKRVIRASETRIGKDEMNLIEHPFAVLWQKEPSENIMSVEWDARHPETGRILPASWSVAGHAEHGLPMPTDERVYLVLLELTHEAGFKSPEVHFSRYDVMQRLGWQPSPKSYAMLRTAFIRLQGVNINTVNAFWDPKTKSYSDTGFNIIAEYSLHAEPPGRKSKVQSELPLSWFKWSDVMFSSFQSGYIRSLDIKFALSLKGDIALRLYRYLDKKTFGGREPGREYFEIELFALCIEHLGMKPTLYPSKLKERLQKAHDELLTRGFLHEVFYGEMKQPLHKHRSTKVCYTVNPQHQSIELKSLPSLDTSSTQDDDNPASDEPTASLFDAMTDDAVSQLNLHERMTQIGVSPATAEEFLQTVAPDAIELQLDCLEERRPNDPAATFVKAVRENWALPTRYTKRKNAKTRQEEIQASQEAEKQKKAQEEAARREEMALGEVEETKFDALWDTLDQQTQDRIEIEVRDRLGVLDTGGKNSPRFAAMRRIVIREQMSNLRKG